MTKFRHHELPTKKEGWNTFYQGARGGAACGVGVRGERIGAGARGGGRCARPAAAFKALRARSAAAAPAPEVRGPASGTQRHAGSARGSGPARAVGGAERGRRRRSKRCARGQRRRRLRRR